MRSILPAYSAIVALGYLTAAGGGTDAVGAPGFLGQWVSELDGLGLTIDADGGFLIHPTDGRAAVPGTWTEADGEITFANQVDSPVCPGMPGTYYWTLNDAGNLMFAIADDACPPRIMQMEQPFDSAT